MSARPLSVPVAAKAAVAILFAALLFFGMPAPAAHAATDAEVTLNVTTKSGAGLAGLRVYAYPVTNHAIVGEGITAAYVGGTTTYELTLTIGRPYALYFDAPGSATTAFDQFWGGTTWPEEAQYLTPAGDTTLDITLATNSTLTGKVTGAKSKALSGVAVYPWRFDGNRWFRLAAAKAVTGSTGVYTMRNLEPGTYRLEFAPANTTGYLSEYSGNTAVFDAAAPLTLGLGATVTHNAALAAGGTLTGSVAIYMDGQAIPADHITAFAYAVEGGVIDTSRAYLSKPTAANGRWTVTGLPAGTYKVKLYDTLSYAFVDRWVGSTALGNPAGTATAATAATYSVALGKTTTTSGVSRLDFYDDLPDTSLELTVAGVDGGPVGLTADVYIESISGEDFFFESDENFGLEDGVMRLAFMPEGEYRVWIDPHDGISQPYIGTHTILARPGGNAWDIELAAVSAFGYSVPATVSSGSTAVGSTYTVNRGQTTLDDGTGLERAVDYSYIWLRDGAPIYGAQAPGVTGYTTRGADLGTPITVIVRADAFGYDPVFTVLDVVTPTIAPAPQSDPGDPPAVVAPAAPVPGSVLTAKVGAWDVGGLAYAYQWFADGAPIAGATGRTYTVATAHAGHAIGVEVTASKPGHQTSAPAASAGTVLIGHLAAPKLKKSPAFKVVTIADGIRITASHGTWSPAPTGYRYDWMVGGVAYGTGSSPVFECLVTAVTPCVSAGLAIQATVTAERTGSSDGTRTSTVRRGTIAPSTIPGPIGFVYDNTDGGHPSFHHPTDPAQIGHVLMASNPVYGYPGSDGGVLKRTYQWQRKSGSKWSNISKATRVSYVPTKSDLNRELRLRVTTTSTLYPTKAEYFTAGTARYRLDLVNGPHPVVSVAGTALAGTTKRATLTGSWPVSGVAHRYQWYSCAAGCSDPFSVNWVAIKKATSSSIVPSSAYQDRQLLVQVTGSKSGYQSYAIRSAALAIDPAANPSEVMAFTSPAYASGLVSGTAAVGRTIKVTPAALDRSSGVTRVHTWYLCDDDACSTPSPAGGSSTSFAPPGALLADGNPHWIQVAEDIYVGGVLATRLETAPIQLVAGTWAPSKAPGLSTQANTPAGQTTWTVTRTWPGDVVLGYQWYEGTVPTAGTPSYGQAPGTEPIWVEVTAQRPGYQPLTYKLIARKGAFPSQDLALSGARYGDALQLATPVTLPLNAPAASVKYQWYSGSKAIKKATKPTLVPGTAYIGKTLKLRVTVGSPYYASTSYYSTPVVLGAHLAAAGTPTIVSTPGTFAPGAKLTVSAVGYPSGMKYAWLWQRQAAGSPTWVNITTKSSYVLQPGDAGAKIRVRLTASRGGWTTSAIYSAEQAIAHSAPLALTAPFVLGGTAKVDTAVTAPTAWNTTKYALTYQWTRNGVAIPGATSSSIVPTASWFGDELQARVTAAKAGHLPVTVASNTVTVGAGAAPTATGVTVAHAGGMLRVTPGVWSVAGVTIGYAWYAGDDPGTLLAGTATFTPPGDGVYMVRVTATRPGYDDGVISKTVTVQS